MSSATEAGARTPVARISHHAASSGTSEEMTDPTQDSDSLAYRMMIGVSAQDSLRYGVNPRTISTASGETGETGESRPGQGRTETRVTYTSRYHRGLFYLLLVVALLSLVPVILLALPARGFCFRVDDVPQWPYKGAWFCDDDARSTCTATLSLIGAVSFLYANGTQVDLKLQIGGMGGVHGALELSGLAWGLCLACLGLAWFRPGDKVALPWLLGTKAGTLIGAALMTTRATFSGSPFVDACILETASLGKLRSLHLLIPQSGNTTFRSLWSDGSQRCGAWPLSGDVRKETDVCESVGLGSTMVKTWLAACPFLYLAVLASLAEIFVHSCTMGSDNSIAGP